MRTILIILSLAFFLTADSQIPKDKQLHFSAGVIFTGFTYYTVEAVFTEDQFTDSYARWKPITISLGVCTLAGVGKETWDYLSYGVFDPKDLAATMLGGVATIGVIEGVRGIVKHHRKRHLLKLKYAY